MTRVRVAIAQAESAPTLEEGLARTSALTAHAAKAGARLVIFPETWLPGYPAWLDVCRDVALWDHEPVKAVFGRYASECVVVNGESGRALRETALGAGVTLVVGICERVPDGPGRGTLYNALLVIGPDGEVRNHHRKLMPTYTERLVWGQGDSDGLRAVDTPVGRIGGMICWEHWMPLARQALHDSGEDIHAALWPTAYERNQIASRHYAFEGRCFVLAAGSLMRASSLPAELEPDPRRVTSGDQLVVRGGSAIIAPDGTYVVPPVFDEPRLIVEDIDLSRVREESMTLDVSGHYSRGDCFQFATRRSGRLSGLG
jgi:nitrilase